MLLLSFTRSALWFFDGNPPLQYESVRDVWTFDRSGIFGIDWVSS